MSKKQYELKEYGHGLFVQDNENNKVQYYSQSKASMNKIVDLMNEKNELINALKQENKQLEIDILGQSEEIEVLSDENKRLKQENKRLKQGKYIYGVHGGSNNK